MLSILQVRKLRHRKLGGFSFMSAQLKVRFHYTKSHYNQSPSVTEILPKPGQEACSQLK